MTSEHASKYWPSLIQAIRRARNWSQAAFASEVDSNQETVSRWEKGTVTPSLQEQQRIEQIAEEANVSSLGGIALIVRLSPYPMLLCDRNDNVLAASTCSGFIEGRSVASQTPETERKFYEEFALGLTESGFWESSGHSHYYHFHSPERVALKAVLVTIRVQAAIYCVVQAIPQTIAP